MSLTPAHYAQECDSLVDVCHQFGKRGWCQATSGNFSRRVDDEHCLITCSGRDKSQLSRSDLMLCDLQGRAINPGDKPSAETPLHVRLYHLDPSIGAVLHTHSVYATLLSRHCETQLLLSGFEMQKALRGVTSHTEQIAMPVFDNNQNTVELADVLENAWLNAKPGAPGFLIRGHGLYAWGRDTVEAKRHVEGLEFLLECRWREISAQMS